jgi:helicase
MNPSIQAQTDRWLTPPQADILASDLLTSGFNCVLQMPTGSGKTWLAEQAIQAVLQRGRRALYLTPLRALATELATRWQQRFSDVHVGVFTGDYGRTGQPYPVSFNAAQLLVMTPERLDACTRTWRAHWHWLPDIDLVVVDELHLLGDGQRGARLEGAISRLRRLNPFVTVLGLSATLGNRQELANWLDGVAYQSSWRPVPLEWHIVRYRKADDKPALLLAQVARMVQAGGKSLVFVQSRRRAEALCRQLQAQGMRAHHHHAGLLHQERKQVEHDFRTDTCDVLVATTTLEMGLNLPVRQVVLYDLQTFDGSDFVPLAMNSVWQRVGRAGRPGLDDQGEAVLLAPVWDREAERYTRALFDPIHSRLSDPRLLAEQIIAEVASGLSRTPEQLIRLFAHSLAAQQQRLPDVQAVIADMEQAGMLKYQCEEAGRQMVWRLQATRLGRVAVRHMLSPTTMLLFQRVLQSAHDLTFFDLLVLVSCSPDAEPVLPVDFEELDTVADYLSQESSSLLSYPVLELTSLTGGTTGKRLLAAIKMALIMRSWTRSGNSEQVAETYGCYPFEVRRLQESLSRLLLAMGATLEKPSEQDTHHLFDDELCIPVRERVQVLQKMVEGGLDEAMVTLTNIPGIGTVMAKRLSRAGIADIEDLALSETSELENVPGLSAQRATVWITAAIDMIQTRSARRYMEVGGHVSVVKPGWPDDVDPYRLRRALDLTVSGIDGDCYLVTGGLEPHMLRWSDGTWMCDCADANKGHGYQCKHILAVRLFQQDPTVYQLVKQLHEVATPDRLDIFQLWFDRSVPTERK